MASEHVLPLVLEGEEVLEGVGDCLGAVAERLECGQLDVLLLSEGGRGRERRRRKEGKSERESESERIMNE